jgi:hypothetical protein
VFTVGKKVWRVAETVGMSAKELAEALGIGRTAVYAYRDRPNANPSPEKVAAFVEHLVVIGYTVPLGWFYDGEDSPVPLKDPKRSEVVDKPKAIYSFGFVYMRYAGVVPCGDWGDPLDSEELVEMGAELDHPKRYVTSVIGDSCYPALKQGDKVVWHQDFAPTAGLIVLAQRKGDHGCTVKQLKTDDQGRPHLVPINPSYDEPANGDGWGVIARLVAVIRKTAGMKVTFVNPDGLRPSDLTGEL